MMIEAGLAMTVLAAMLASAVPVDRALSVRKHHRAQPVIGPPLRAAFPLVAPRPDLEALKIETVRAVDACDCACDLDRGVGELAEVYRRAARAPVRRARRRQSTGD
jgi:hypothetical protein